MAKLWLQQTIFTIGKYCNFVLHGMFGCLGRGMFDEETWRWPWNRRWTAGDSSDRDGTDPTRASWGTAECSLLRRASGSWRSAGTRRTRSPARLRTTDDAAAPVKRR